MSPEEFAEMMEEMNALVFNSDYCSNCQRPSIGATFAFIPLKDPISLKGKDYTNVACTICPSCKDTPDKARILKNLVYFLSEMDVTEV